MLKSTREKRPGESFFFDRVNLPDGERRSVAVLPVASLLSSKTSLLSPVATLGTVTSLAVSALGCSVSIRDLLPRHPLPLVSLLSPLILVQTAGPPETGAGAGSAIGVQHLDHVDGGQRYDGDGADQQQDQAPPHARLDQPGALPGSLADVCHGAENHDQVDQPQDPRRGHRPEQSFHGWQEPGQTGQDHDGDAEQEGKHTDPCIHTACSGFDPKGFGRRPWTHRTGERQHTGPHGQAREQRNPGSGRLETSRHPVGRGLESEILSLFPPALRLVRAVSLRGCLIWRLRGHRGPFVTSVVRDHSAPFASTRQPLP